MRYIDVLWLIDADEEPYRLISEIGPDNFEVRKIDLFRNGEVGFASKDANTSKTMLGTVEVPTLEEINTDDEFDGKNITADDFEKLWLTHVELNN